MRLAELFREIIHSARARVVPTVLTVFLTAAMCVLTLLTVGRTASAQQMIEARLDTAESRTIIFSDSTRKGFLTPSVVEMVAQLSGVERAIGLGPAIDATSLAAPSTRVATWQLTGDLEHAASLTVGRAPLPGEALVSRQAMDALGMDAPVGAIRMIGSLETYPVVGGVHRSRAVHRTRRRNHHRSIPVNNHPVPACHRQHPD